MIQKRMKTILIVVIMLVSVSLFFLPSASADVPVTIYGYIYADEIITDPDQVTLVFSGSSFIAELLGSGSYRINEDLQDYMGNIGYFDVIISGTSYTANETITISGPGAYEKNLHVNTSGTPASNDPPDVPTSPIPADGEADVVKNIIISWSCIDPDNDPLTYDVYFGTNSNPPIQSTGQTANSYDPSILIDDTDYYWKIVAYDDHSHMTEGPIWQFTTGTETNNPPNIPSNPFPANNTNNIDRNQVINWTCTDPDGDSLTYDVYFGTNPDPSKVPTSQTTSSYDPGTMSYNTRYYWKIVAKDNKGGTNTSPIWNFKTEKGSGGNGGNNGNDNPKYTKPIANANGPYFDFIINGQASVNFDGTGSTGSINTYFWKFGDGGNATGVQPTYIFTQLGNFTVNLTVTGPVGSDSDQTYVVISEEPNIPPESPIVTGPNDGSKNIEYSFTANSTDADGDDLYYMFDWGDGSKTISNFTQNATQVTFNNSWSTWGIYTISVTASDNKTNSDATEHVILIDVIWVKTIGYLIDTDSDGDYEKFYSNETETQTNPKKLENGSYLINSDTDKEYDWIYDPITDTLWKYNPSKEPDDYTLWYALAAILIILFLLIIAGIIGKRQKDKTKKKQAKKKKK